MFPKLGRYLPRVTEASLSSKKLSRTAHVVIWAATSHSIVLILVIALPSKLSLGRPALVAYEE